MPLDFGHCEIRTESGWSRYLRLLLFLCLYIVLLTSSSLSKHVIDKYLTLNVFWQIIIVSYFYHLNKYMLFL